MSARVVLRIGEDNTFTWSGAVHTSTGLYVNSGTGSWELKSASNLSLKTGTLSYVAASNGDWRGTLDKVDAAGLTEGGRYYLELTLSDGAGADGFRRLTCVAWYHDY
jgi:hypothetical protein